MALGVNTEGTAIRQNGYSMAPAAVRSRNRREYLRKYQSKWMAERRAAWVKENGPCAVCGSTDRLEVDHKDHTQKTINPRALWSMSPNNVRRIAELRKCQVLCHDCHVDKSRPLFIANATKQAQTRPRNAEGRWL